MRSHHFLLLAVALTSLTACADHPDLPTSGPLAVYRASGEGGDAAQLEGRLTKRDGCVVVESGSGAGAVTVPVFPDEATWTDDGLAFAGRIYEEGTSVSMDGGGGGDATSDSTTYVPAACADTRTFLVAGDTESLDPS